MRNVSVCLFIICTLFLRSGFGVNVKASDNLLPLVNHGDPQIRINFYGCTCLNNGYLSSYGQQTGCENGNAFSFTAEAFESHLPYNVNTTPHPILSTSYNWDFGDVASGFQNYSNLANPVHYFTSPGPFTVTLTATVNYLPTGATVPTPIVVTATAVIVQNGIIPTFSVTPTNPLAGGVTSFTFNGVLQNLTVAFGTIDFGDSSPTSSVSVTGSSSIIAQHTYQAVGAYTVTLTLQNDICVFTYSTVFTVEDPQCCEVSIPIKDPLSTQNKAGNFFVDHSTGQILYVDPSCPDNLIPFNCFGEPKDIRVYDGVISANAKKFKSDWPYDANLYPITSSLQPNQFEKGEANKWRVSESFTYREELDLATVHNKNFDRGTFGFSMFDWDNPDNNDPYYWVLTSRVNSYTPNSQPREDENVLKIKSTAQYGYNQTLPICVAQNAYEGAIWYESFENTYSNGSIDYLENGLDFQPYTPFDLSADAHTGSASIVLGGSILPVGRVLLSTSTFNKGFSVRVWVKKTDKLASDLIHGANTYLNLRFSKQGSSWVNTEVPFIKISDAGEWSLYEGILKSYALTTNSIVPGDKVNIGVQLKNYPGNSQILVDDVKIQPLDASAVCYVYDSRQQIIGFFDDQHYALIYQYNTRGQLIRKAKETEFGIKTISETQYNVAGH